MVTGENVGRPLNADGALPVGDLRDLGRNAPIQPDIRPSSRPEANRPAVLSTATVKSRDSWHRHIRRTLKISTKNPLLLRIVDECVLQGLTYSNVEREAGLGHGIISLWIKGHRHVPNIANLIAVYQVLGLTLVPAPLSPPVEDSYPPRFPAWARPSLDCLRRYPDKLVSRDVLLGWLEFAIGRPVSAKYVDTCIWRVRCAGFSVETVWGRGFIFRGEKGEAQT